MRGARLSSRRVFALALFVMGVAAACCEDPTPPVDTLELGELQAKVTSALCGRAVACARFPDEATCAAALALDYKGLEADSKAGRVYYDPKQGKSCVDDIESGKGPGSCSITELLSSSDLSSCAAAVIGFVKKGEGCVANYECGTRLCDFSGCSADADVCCAGTCQELVRPMGDCSLPGAVCMDGTACVEDPTGLGLLCEAQVDPGKPCSGSSQCKAGSLCVIDDPTTASGTCRALPAEGQPCAVPGNPECDSFNDYCDPVTKKCVPRAGKGGECPKHVECAWFERCDVVSLKCVAKGAVGSACAADDDCLDPLACVNGACGVPTTSRVCPVPGT